MLLNTNVLFLKYIYFVLTDSVISRHRTKTLLFRRGVSPNMQSRYFFSIFKSSTPTHAMKMDTELFSPGLFRSHPGLWEQPTAPD